MIYALVQSKYLGRRIQICDTPIEAIDKAAKRDRIFKLFDHLAKQPTQVICDLIDYKAEKQDFVTVGG